jgi:hypothetical protein
MKEEIEQLLPLIKIGKVSEAEIQNITDRIRLSIKEDSSKGKELGELLSRIKQASKAKNLHTEVNWVQVGKGFLAIGHKPGGKISFEGLKNEGTSAVLTLLNENEGAAAIGKQLRTVNIEWIWFPFSASKPHDGEDIAQIYSLYNQLASLINAAAKIYIHCSAGIHRTGMITYGFLRFLGQGKTEAFGILQSLREVTAAQVGEARLIWADQFDSNNHNEI